jgi:hypothetical protein
MTSSISPNTTQQKSLAATFVENSLSIGTQLLITGTAAAQCCQLKVMANK